MTIVRIRALAAFPAGLRATAHRPRLIAGLWAWQVVISTAAALPLFRGLIAATAYSPGSDPLLERFSVSLFGEILQYNALPLVQMLQLGAVGALLISVVTAPVLVALAISSLEAPGRVPAADLAAAAGRWYFPLFRLLIGGRVVALFAAVLAGAAARALLAPLSNSTWELGRLLIVPAIVGIALLVLTLFWAAADYAAIHAIRAGSRRMFSAWHMGLRASLGRPITTLGVWLLAAVTIAGLAALLFAVLGTVGGAAPAAIAAGIVVQQLFAIFRIGIRVGLLGAEAAAWRIVPPVPAATDVAGLSLDTGTPAAGVVAVEDESNQQPVSRSVTSPEEDQGPGKDGQREIHEGQQPKDSME